MKHVDVGIDLGTTYSTFATFENGKINILKNSRDSATTPSVVSVENGKILIGDDAKEYQRQGNTNTVAFYKSRMGDSSYAAYLDGNEYSAADLSAIFLASMKKDIEESNDVIIDHAVITVPAYFNDKQREATLLAGKKAGLNVVKIINEPTSAIIAYGLADGKDKTVMVYDLGGGTFDVTIASIKGNRISVLSTNGNHQLGGKDWDEQLLSIVGEQMSSQLGVNIEDYPEDYTEIMVHCEEIKKRLTVMDKASMNLSCDGRTAKVEVTRKEFDERTNGLLQETFDLVDVCFQEIAESTGKPFSWKNLDEVVLVGGSTRMPQVKERIKQEYKKEPVTKNINVDTIVASGAAMQVQLSLHSKLSLTVAKKDERTGKISLSSLTLQNTSIQDITAHGLGMISKDAQGRNFVNSIIIPKNSRVNQVFSKNYEFKGDKLEVYCLQGENRDPVANDLLGYYVISGMKKGLSDRIQVNYLYNSNGIVEVSSVDSVGNKLNAERKDCDLTIEEILAKLKKQEEDSIKAMKRQAVEVTLAIDVSGSMYGEPIELAKREAKKFLGKFQNINNVKISFAIFADQFKYLAKHTSDFKKVDQSIDKCLEADVGSCNYCCPIGSCFHDYSLEGNRFLIILTDGCWVHPQAEIRNATEAKKLGIQIYAIGFGDADEDFLNKISTSGGFKIDLSELSKAFDKVASSIASEISSNTIR